MRVGWVLEIMPNSRRVLSGYQIRQLGLSKTKKKIQIPGFDIYNPGYQKSNNFWVFVNSLIN